MKTRVLTGITTTGEPHLGNYAGAIRPAILASQDPAVEAFYFLADHHALIKCPDPERIRASSLSIAATWLACGLDAQKCCFYRQSDIPEIMELNWLLTCVAAKGLLNRAHAYKAAVDANMADNEDPDYGISLGLFQYPVLMAADILMFKAQKVPVGRDQVQHVEIARDLALRFNHLYGEKSTSKDHGPLVLPEAVIEMQVAILPGLDGRKMSKSYQNTIPLWLDVSSLKNTIARITTDSKLPGEPKSPESTSLSALYRAFSNIEKANAYDQALREGMAWGEAKTRLFECLNENLAEGREKYQYFLQQKELLQSILEAGALKARAMAKPFLDELKTLVGLKSANVVPVASKSKKATKLRSLTFKDEQGFRFRWLDGEGKTLLLSECCQSGSEAGALNERLLSEEWELRILNKQVNIFLQDVLVALSPECDPEEVLRVKEAIEQWRQQAISSASGASDSSK